MKKNRLAALRPAALFLAVLAALVFCTAAAGAEDVPTYFFDVNLSVLQADGSEYTAYDGVEGVTFDVWIDGVKAADDIQDYSPNLPDGTAYLINDVKATGLYTVDAGLSFSGTVHDTTDVMIPVTGPLLMSVDVQIDGEQSEGHDDRCDYCFDVYADGEKVLENASVNAEFQIKAGGTYEIKNIRTRAGTGTDGYTMPARYHVTGTATVSGPTAPVTLPPLCHDLDVNVQLDEGSWYNDGVEGITFDVVVAGQTVADDVKDYCAPLPVGVIYLVNDIRVADGADYAVRPHAAYTGTVPKEAFEQWIACVSHNWSGAVPSDGAITYTCAVCGETRSYDYRDLGESFRAFICQQINEEDGFYFVQNDSGAVSVGTAADAEKNIWRFERQDNGAYVLISEADGKALTLSSTVIDPLAGFPLTTAAKTGKADQQFYLTDTYALRPVSTAGSLADRGWWDDRLPHALTMCDYIFEWDLRVISDLGAAFSGELLQDGDRNFAVDFTNKNVDLNRVSGAAAQSWRFTRQANGAYVITNMANTLCLTAGDTENNYRNAVLAAANGTAAQQWFFLRADTNCAKFFLQSADGGRVLDLQNGEREVGTNIGLWHLHGDWQERWILRRHLDLGETYSAQMVHAVSSVPAVNTAGNLETGVWHGAANADVWTFTRLDNGAYTIAAPGGKLVWTAENGGGAGENVKLAAPTGGADQQWFLYADSDINSAAPDTVCLRPACSAAVLDLWNNIPDEGTNIQLYDYGHSANNAQRWRLLSRVTRPGFYAEILSDTDAAESIHETLSLLPYDGSSRQLWYFDPQPDDTYRIVSATDGLKWYTDGYEVLLTAAADAADTWVLYRGRDGRYFLRFAPENYGFVMADDSIHMSGSWNDDTPECLDFNVYEALDSITFNAAAVIFNGKARSPVVTVKDTYGRTVPATGYTVTVPAGRTNVGSYTYTATGKGAYRGSVSAVFTIKAQTLKAENITVYAETVTYNGKVRTPVVTVKNAAGETLRKDTDYTVTVPAGRQNAGTYTYVIKGKGNYTGTVNKTFTINPETLGAANITLRAETVTYNGKVRTPVVTVKNAAGETLQKDTDYTVTAPAGRQNAGTYTYVITGKGNYTGTVRKTFTVNPQPFKAENVTVYAEAVTYNGKVRTPKVTVKSAEGTVLTAGTDYTVTVPAGRQNAGTYTYVITGKGNYAGSVNKTFTVNAQTLKAENITVYAETVTYNGKVRTPKVTVKSAEGTVLTAGTDYTVTVPAGRQNAGIYTYVITGKGNYTGTVRKTFTIRPETLGAETVTLYSETVIYNGKVRTPVVTVKNAAGETLTEGTDYTVTIPAGRKDTGTYTYIIEGMGNYAGSVSKIFTIRESLKAANVTVYAASVVYNGKVRTPAVTVKNAAGVKLTEGVDYTVAVPAGRKDPGVYTYTITGIGLYTGTVTKTFTITDPVKAANITLYSETVTYNGKVRTPRVTVTNSAGVTLVEGTDYTVSVPAGRQDPGAYEYVITGLGVYAGTATKVFTIRPETLKAANVTLYSETVTYNGKVRTPTVTVKNNAGETLTKGVDYVVTVPAGRTQVGTYTYVIEGVGLYGGTVEKVFTIKAQG